MIEKTLKTTSGKLKVTIPSALHEITVAQLIAMQANDGVSDVEVISILSGIPAEDLNNVTDARDIYQFSEHVLSLANQIKYLYNSDAIPEHVIFKVDGKAVKVKVIKNLSIEPAGAFMASREVIADEISNHIKQHGEQNWQQSFNPSLQACCRVLAQYFYCRAAGKPYNELEAEAFYDVVTQLPITDALPIAKYFF